MTDYKSELETLAPCKELLFKGTPGFGRYASLLSHSVGHPAKMNTRLTEFLILELTKPGEIILDPMSGTAQTGLIASVNSRNAVCVELETKFHNWQLEAKSKLEAYQTFTVKGSLSCIQGDARKLSELLQTVDAVVTSPPYSDMKKGKFDPEDWANRMEKFGSTPESRRERHTPGRLKGAQSMSEGYSKSPDNIGNLPMGEIDAVITSPPYAQVVSKKHGGTDPNPNMAGGSDIISLGYSDNPANIGNLPIDAIITSPPYEKTIKDHGTSERATKINLEKNNLSSWAYNAENPDNIGNKAKETYLQAMLQVYSEMFQVLKPGGVAAIIVKPFIRNRKVVDLPFQTWLLLQKCGFQLIKSYKLRLDQQSFWRILYMQKNPEVPQIWHEWVLVCRKPLFISSEVNSKEVT
jgi:DNA modification methylase